MLRERLTEARIQAIYPPPAGKRIEIMDAGCPGLWLRVTPDGSRSFAVRFRSNNKDARITLGKYPLLTLKQARAEATDALQTIRRRIDPRKGYMSASSRSTFHEVWEEFRRYRSTRRGKQALKDSHLTECARRFRTILLPRWHDRPFVSIERADVQALMDELDSRSPTLARHVWYDLKVLFKYAVRREYVATSPLEKIEPPSKPEERDRVLTPEELARVWRACASPTTYHTIIKLLILTGARRGEVAGAEWKEFTFDDPTTAVWTLTKWDTKNKREHRLPLSSVAIELINAWRLLQAFSTLSLSRRRNVFPNEGVGLESSFVGFSRSKRRLDKQANVHHWQVHDLRRTVATRLAEQGTLPHVIERILNHVSGTMAPIARVYNRYAYEAEMREALEKWATFLRAL